MCPDVEKRLRELKNRKNRETIHVVKKTGKGITRRELLKVLGALPVAPAVPTALGMLGFSGLPHALELDLLPFNWGCVNCSIGFCVCWEGTPPKPIISLKNSYWYPVGFIEINKACNFLTSLLPVMGEVVGSVASELCNALPTGWLQGSDMSQNTGIGKLDQQYMRVHARWYGMTPEIEVAVLTYLETVALCPCAVVDMVKNTLLGPVYDRLTGLEERIQEVGSDVRDALGLGRLLRMLDKVRQVLDGFDSFPLPVWFTEVLSPIWLIDVLSVDNFVLGGLKSALVSAALSHPASKIALCSGVLQKLQSVAPDIFGMLDPSFVCVGFWGYGYPRIGVVRNDDPLISHLLAVARFHHLYSKTIPVIPFGFDYNNTRYQLVRPFSSECMKPGCGGFALPNICELDGNPLSLFNMLKNKAIGLAGRSMNAVDRKTFLVVWKKRSQCCC